MDEVTALGRIFFALSMLGFAVQQFMFNGFLAGLELIPEHIPGHTFWAYVTGVALLAGGVCIALGKRTRPAALALALAFFVFVLLRRLPGISVIL